MSILVHQTVFKFDPQIFIILFVYLKQPFLTVFLEDRYFDIRILNQKLIIKNILDVCAVNRKECISCLNFQFLCNTARKNPLNNMLLMIHSFHTFRFTQKLSSLIILEKP